MRRLLFLAPLVALLLVVSSVVRAQGGKTAQGTVTAVSAASLTVADAKSGTAKAPQTFTLDEKTQVYARGATRALKGNERGPATSLIAKGDQVSVTYEEVSGAMHATEVRVTKKASTK